MLFHLLSKHYKRTNVIITTNLSFGKWARMAESASRIFEVTWT
ncbi:hypothetical protein DSM109990_03927 (plasmid) [Sulfitobacter dubius]|uniref:IstB-like ATP-binding domain-containing protein n=1 Tax=Sulfitobacter dubius TaxID=218673 RepID=A0ABY3ZQZ0_9RHOB|nr:hypothetical protein DSM109990_03927 [Sulfitobacter dubius]